MATLGVMKTSTAFACHPGHARNARQSSWSLLVAQSCWDLQVKVCMHWVLTGKDADAKLVHEYMNPQQWSRQC